MQTSELNVIQTRISSACSGGASVGKDDMKGSCILEIVVAILLAISMRDSILWLRCTVCCTELDISFSPNSSVVGD